LQLWQEREKLLTNIFLASEGIGTVGYLEVVASRVTVPERTAIHTFPTRNSTYHHWDSEGIQDREFENEELVLTEPLMVDNPVVVNRPKSGLLPSQNWLLVNGPRGAGYIYYGRGELPTEAKDKEVLVGAFWAGEGHDGELRFTASGYAYAGTGDPIDSSDRLGSVLFFSGPSDVQKLGEGLQHSEYIPLSATVTPGHKH
jgi:hypothetical protein